MNVSTKPYFVQALDALKLGDRRGAAALLAKELRYGNTSPRNLPSVAQLAAHIGEVDLAIDASRRWSPETLESKLGYWAMLATYGRASEALAEIDQQSDAVKENSTVLHFRGTAASQLGHFKDAENLFRRALAKAPSAMETWFSLAMIRKFEPGDPDIATMERLERTPGAPPEARASLCYGIGKAWDDCGDVDRAFGFYSKGAALRRLQRPFDIRGFEEAAEQSIRDFTAENMGKLARSGFEGQRSLFVTGLPRSGTTLTEQILLGHSAVADGAEDNLFTTASMPLHGHSFSNAVRYQRSNPSDPWGEIARDYDHLVDVHFRTKQLVVDKSLGQGLQIGLILHSMPDARIAWLRRSPDDVALSCFRTYFSAGLSWTCSLADIADYMRSEDRLFEHWCSIFPDRILVVPYEQLVEAPAIWSERLQQHFSLPLEVGVEALPRRDRAVRTASVAQVNQPISTSRIGQSKAYEPHLKPFRDRYYA